MTYSPEYKALQEQFHRDRPDYGISGNRYADQVLNLSKQLNTRDILDYGCGKCTLQQSLPFAIKNYDPFIPEHSARPEPADIVVCTDVLEHIEPDHLEEVLDDLRSLTNKVVFLQVATRPASKNLPDGRNAHLIIEQPVWWLARIFDYFGPLAFQDMKGGFMFIGTPFKHSQP